MTFCFAFSDCVGLKGCEWCQFISNSNNTFEPLAKKFCTTQDKCFGGVLNARTPYSDEINGKVKHFILFINFHLG